MQSRGRKEVTRVTREKFIRKNCPKADDIDEFLFRRAIVINVRHRSSDQTFIPSISLRIYARSNLLVVRLGDRYHLQRRIVRMQLETVSQCMKINVTMSHRKEPS